MSGPAKTGAHENLKRYTDRGADYNGEAGSCTGGALRPPAWPLPGGPEASLEWLRANLQGQGLSLRPGDLVLAGTPLGLLPVQAADRVLVVGRP